MNRAGITKISATTIEAVILFNPIPEKKSTEKTRYRAADNKPDNKSMIEMATTNPTSIKDRLESIEPDSRCET
jgi:hypothetical protein